MNTSGSRPNSKYVLAAMLAAIMLGAVPEAYAQEALADVRPAAEHTGGAARGKLTSAVKQPLNDFNLMRSEIPAVLQMAREAPYARLSASDCPTLSSELEALEAVLGPGLDDADTGEATLKEKARAKAFDIARGAASGFIPHRGAVRFVTGAEKHDRLVREATFAGEIRRAYLKGLGESLGCVYPASPKRSEETTQPQTDLIASSTESR